MEFSRFVVVFVGTKYVLFVLNPCYFIGPFGSYLVASCYGGLSTSVFRWWMNHDGEPNNECNGGDTIFVWLVLPMTTPQVCSSTTPLNSPFRYHYFGCVLLWCMPSTPYLLFRIRLVDGWWYKGCLLWRKGWIPFPSELPIWIYGYSLWVLSQTCWCLRVWLRF